MHALIVVSHPLASSLTHRVAHALAEGITSTHSENSADIADLTREGFNPVFNESDYAAFMKTAPLPPDVAASRRASITPTRWCWSFRCTGGQCRAC